MLTAGAAHASPQPYSDDADTVLLFHLDEDTGATTLVESSGGHHATLRKLGKVGQPSMTGFGSALHGSAGLAARATFVDSGMGAASFLHPAITEDFTIEAWVKLDTTDFENDRIITVVQPVGVPAYDYALAIFGTHNKLHPMQAVFGAELSADVGQIVNLKELAAGVTPESA